MRRIGNESSPYLPAFNGDFEAHVSVLRQVAAPQASAAKTRFAIDGESGTPAKSDPKTWPGIENLVFVSPPDALGAGRMYVVVKEAGKEVLTVIDATTTPGFHDWATGIRALFSEKFGRMVDGQWVVDPRALEDVADMPADPSKEQQLPDVTAGGKYKEATGEPSVRDIERISSEAEFPDAIRYEIRESARSKYDGNTFLYVSKNQNPGLYDAAHEARQLLLAKAEARENGLIVADDNTLIPHSSQVRIDTIRPVEGVSRALTYETKNGEKIFVSKELASSLFAAIDGFAAEAELIGKIDLPVLTKGAIYNEHIEKVELNHDNKALPEGILKVTLKGHPTFGDGSYLVTDASNSQAHDTALSWYNGGANVKNEPVEFDRNYNDINSGGGGRLDARDFEERFSLSRSDWDITSAKTTTRVDEKDDKSRFMSVGELAMKKLREKYEDLAKQDPDSKAARFIAILDGVAAHSSGRSIQAYTQGAAVSSISGEFYVPSEDWQEVIDYEKLMKASTEIWQDPGIQKDYAAIIDDTINGLDGPSMEDRARKLYDLIVGSPVATEENIDGLAAWVAEMKQQNRSGEAEQIVRSVWSSLAMLDKPDADGRQVLVEQAMNEFQSQVMIGELDAHIEAGIGNDEHSFTALQSTANLLLSLARTNINIARAMPRMVDFFEGVVSGKIKADTALDVFHTLEKASDKGVFDFDKGKLDELFKDKTYSAPERATIVGFLDEASKHGFLGTASGTMSLVSGILRLTQSGDKDLTTEDQLLIARDFLSFLSTSEHFFKLGNSTVQLFSKNADIVKVLGLTSNIPTIWGQDGKWGKKLETPKTAPDLIQALADSSKTTWDQWMKASEDKGWMSKLEGMTAEQRAQHASITKLLDDANSKEAWQARIDSMSPDERAKNAKVIEEINNGTINKGLPPDGISSRLSKSIGSTVLAMGNGLDAPLGIMDIVFNALKLSKANGHGETIASSVFGLLGGTAATGAGVLVGVQTFVRTLPFLTLAAPLFLVGNIFGVISILIELAASQRDTDEKLDKQREWLATLDKADVLKENWGDAFEFINTWYAYAKGRNDLYDPTDDIPNGLSIFDFDRERWDRFRDGWEPGELPREAGFFSEDELEAWWANEIEDLVFDWKFSEDNYDPGDKLSPDHPARKALEENLDGLASWYADNIDLSTKPVGLATIDNAEPRRVVQEMTDYFLTHIDASADTETIAEWIKGQFLERLPKQFENADDGRRAAGAFDVYYRNGGDEVMGEIITATFSEGNSPRVHFEDTLNTLVAAYARDGIGRDGDRMIAGFNQDGTEVKPLFRDLIVYYFEEVNSKGSAKDAADWAIDEVKGRIGSAFNPEPSAEDKERIEIFMNYVNKKERSGRADALAVAEDVLASGA